MLHGALTQGLHQLPEVFRKPLLTIAVRRSSVVWRRSPYLVNVVAPAIQPLELVGKCSCAAAPLSVPRWNGHVITRYFDRLPCCSQVFLQTKKLRSFQMRLIPSLEYILEMFDASVVELFKHVAEQPARDAAVSAMLQQCHYILKTWNSHVPKHQLLHTARAALFQTHRAGMVYMAIDRNPGKFLCLRVEALSFDTEVSVCQ